MERRSLSLQIDARGCFYNPYVEIKNILLFLHTVTIFMRTNKLFLFLPACYYVRLKRFCLIELEQ